jgi:hypothetical protein
VKWTNETHPECKGCADNEYGGYMVVNAQLFQQYEHPDSENSAQIVWSEEVCIPSVSLARLPICCTRHYVLRDKEKPNLDALDDDTRAEQR